MGFCRALGDHQVLGDLLIAHSLRDELSGLSFAPTQLRWKFFLRSLCRTAGLAQRVGEHSVKTHFRALRKQLGILALP